MTQYKCQSTKYKDDSSWDATLKEKTSPDVLSVAAADPDGLLKTKASMQWREAPSETQLSVFQKEGV